MYDTTISDILYFDLYVFKISTKYLDCIGHVSKETNDYVQKYIKING